MSELPKLALSIMQPWAWLICNGFKSVENRSWPTRYRGPVAIHAGRKIDTGAHNWVTAGVHPVTGERTLLGIDYPACYGVPIATGGIVGVAELVDCIDGSDDDWFVGPHGFVLANARPIPFIPVKGALGFFEWRKRIMEVPEPGHTDDGSLL
ncbi:ASCH domain-containing protein [Mesorhizobium xinjiangense]|uniref:ASCH domain-containing protein n=1 Tax=Mesorhizobium xinjiangense TaxID=2678685 RepID=UPI0012EE62D5|nr:ASCH domain-containing protein [Mesorhizobium xinjiangense]